VLRLCLQILVGLVARRIVEIVKVSRDTMNYSCRGNAKLRETFPWRGESPSLCASTCTYVCASRCAHEARTRCARASTSTRGSDGDEKGVRRARSRNECGKAVGSSSKPEATLFQEKKEGLNSGWGKWAS